MPFWQCPNCGERCYSSYDHRDNEREMGDAQAMTPDKRREKL